MGDKASRDYNDFLVHLFIENSIFKCKTHYFLHRDRNIAITQYDFLLMVDIPCGGSEPLCTSITCVFTLSAAMSQDINLKKLF